jgi:hypothetical protein
MSESKSDERFYIDDRVGCIAVRDREKDDEWSPGLHSEMDGVMAYWHGRKGPDGVWGVLDWQKGKAKALCDELNATPLREMVPLTYEAKDG